MRKITQRPWWIIATLGALATMILLSNADPAETRPLRGSTKWSILLCTYMDAPAIPSNRTPAFFEQMFISLGTGGLADYWDSISQGSLNLSSSVVRGWYTVPMTVAQAQAKSGGPNPRRGELVTDCISAARNAGSNAYTVPSDHNVAVIAFPDIDFYGGGGRAFVNINVDVGGLGHELGHGLGIEHSYSDDPTFRSISWAAIGEYDDPWDVMSYANAFSVPTTRFGNGGPSLNAYHTDRMGWLPIDRIRTVGADGLTYGTYVLAAVNVPGAAGDKLIRVPLDPGDPYHYITIEFRRKTGWDNGILADVVLMHEVKPISAGVYRSFLLRERGGSRNPVQSVSRPGLTIQVNARSPAIGPDQALVTISSDIAERCLLGYVWREATPGDRVCVTGAVRQQTRDDNAQAAARRQPGGGRDGPDTCRRGFVWREAVAGDHVCVIGATRQQASNDNARAAERRNPARLDYGPNTCQQGFVWREADRRDYVCVSPATRQRARDDNAQADARRQPGGGAFGPNTCRQGFVWREAFPGDFTCVIPATRTQARDDNAVAHSRLAMPGA